MDDPHGPVRSGRVAVVPRLTVDPAEVVQAARRAERTAEDVAGLAAVLGAVLVPDAGRPDSTALVGALLQQVHAASRSMAAASLGTGLSLRAVARTYLGAEAEAAGAPCR